MAWLCRVTVFWLFWTSQLRSEHQQRQTVRWTRHLSSSFLPRGLCSLLSQKKTSPSFLFGEPPAPHPPKEGTLYRWEREKFYICNRGDCFCLYNMVLKSFGLFRNQNPKLLTYLLTYNGTFLILKIELKKFQSSNECLQFPQGKHICTVQNQKTTLRKKT